MADGFGKYDVYSVSGSKYCYSDSSTLKNKLDIHDALLLKRVEADISVARQTEILEHPIVGHFSKTHLCRIHRALLGDVYSFAGHFRLEDIAKGETRFLTHSEIDAKLTKLLNNLRDEHCLSGIERKLLIARSAHYMAELNYIHPFREGNGRAIREFMRVLLLRCGYTVDWSAVSVDALLQAMVDSVYDAFPLEQVLDKCVSLSTNIDFV